ncbi:MAG: hypothetical protein NTU63_00770 [Candidatus Pacearchaeota archaeon]|nr:hypothetical protein [Candidatus Pacearchaeota archaeon]
MVEKKNDSVKKICPKCGGKLKKIYLVDYGIKNKILKTGLHHYKCEKCGEEIKTKTGKDFDDWVSRD